MMFCTKCGNLIHDHFDACGTCGQSYVICPRCKGQGKLPSFVEGWMGPDICPICNGAKKVPQ